jgi:hypothetical protein
MIRDELLKMNKEFYWDCIVEHGYTICPDKIQKMYTNLIKKEYNEENVIIEYSFENVDFILSNYSAINLVN